MKLSSIFMATHPELYFLHLSFRNLGKLHAALERSVAIMLPNWAQNEQQ
jgi:hypothetical protein